MSTKSCALFGAASLSILLSPQSALGQQQTPPVDHRAHAATPQGALDDCMTAQSKVSVTGTTARVRLEEARQTNDPAKLRAAVDEALIAITSLLAATEPCRQAPAMGGMDHSKLAMPQPGAAVSPRPPAAAADPHAGHTMPAKPAAKPGAKAAAKPADPHAGHAAPSGKTVVFSDDPKKLACSPPIDPDDAPATTYKGKAYYFCTAAERLRFITNPETYLKSKGPGQ